MTVHRFAICTLMAVAGLGCGDTSVTNGPGGAPRFEFVSGQPAADTIQARPLTTVTVALRDGDGAAIPNEEVRFETTGDALAGIPFLYLESLDGQRHGAVTETTDADGRAAIVALRGEAAGRAWLRVRAPALAVADSLPFDILPGNPFEIRLSPADTGLHVGATYTLHGLVVDAFDNVRPEAVTFTAESTFASGTGIATVVVTGEGHGRASFAATGGGLSAQAWVSVVPTGTLAFFVRAFTTGDSIGIATASTDGSGYAALFASEFDFASDRPLDWAPDGQRLVFHLGTNIQTFRLYHITLGGVIQPVITQDIGGYPEMFPRYGPDGWIYFTAVVDPSNGTDELWRVHADGTSAERIGPPAAPFESDTYPAPAPDGEHVWFSTDRPSPGPNPVTLAILDVSAGTVDYLDVYGVGAVWSPVGDRVAFIDQVGAIIVAAPDGSGQRVVSGGNAVYEPYLDWSSDGQWIVASGAAGVVLIEPDLGVTLPLAFSERWRHPAWRP